MTDSGNRKRYFALAVCLAIFLAVLTEFLAQSTRPSPSPSVSPTGSPTVSPSATPVRTPSPTPSPGAQNFHRWGSITVFNGLPSDSVRAIAQTPDGVMWFGTDNGLSRFDGRLIQNFTLGESGSNRVLALKTASTGQLWIGTEKGAFIYSDARLRPIDGTQNVGVTAILLGGANYLGTDTGHILRVDGGGDALTVNSLFPNALLSPDGSPLRITGLVDKDGKLLAGTWGGGVYVIENSSVTDLALTPRPLFVNSVAIVSGDLWLGTDAAKGISGIYRIDGGARAVRITAPTANVLAVDSNESGIWVGTERYGLFNLLRSKLTKTYTFDNTSGGLRSDTIYALFTDREGVIWIGTNRGVSRFDRLGPFQQTVSDIPNSNFIRTLWFNGRALYAGSNRGFFEYDYGAEEWRKHAALGDRAIYDIGESYRGLVVATASGMFDLQGKMITSGDTRSVESFGKRTYAAIIGRGVVDISDSPQEIVFPDETASALLATPDRLWIGTSEHGLFTFDGHTTKVEFGPEVLKSGTIWNMTSDLDGSILIAGQHGVFRIANGEIEKLIDVEDVRDVHIDHSDHWVNTPSDVWAASTTRGLLHARRDERFGWIVSSIGFEQGLPSGKAFAIESDAVQEEGSPRLKPGGGVLVGTNRGVVTYRPGLIAPKLIAVRILSQRVHDLAELRSAIELEYPQNSILVEVAGQSSRTFPEEFQYAFLLKNSKGEILDSRISDEPQYAPADLKPGSYSIESRAFDRDLLESEPLVIQFSIARAPFPWTATALGVLLAIAVIALIWAIIERRQIAERNRELASARSDLANEAERERSRIARDLHDQTLADLRNLMMMSDRLTPANPEFRSEIEAVSTEIRRICEDLSPSVLENVGLVSALEFLLTRSIENHRFSASDDANELVMFPLIVQLHIYRIAQEVITNIRRHSDATLVEMRVDVSDKAGLRLAISDNGSSFQPDGSSNSGRGIANIRARASIIDAAIAWEAQPGIGNSFSLEIKPRNVT